MRCGLQLETVQLEIESGIACMSLGAGTMLPTAEELEIGHTSMSSGAAREFLHDLALGPYKNSRLLISVRTAS